MGKIAKEVLDDAWCEFIKSRELSLKLLGLKSLFSVLGQYQNHCSQQQLYCKSVDKEEEKRASTQNYVENTTALLVQWKCIQQTPP